MQTYANYIKEIEIDQLWSGTHHIKWKLHRKVNVLSGVNGVGKSTILNKVIRGLMHSENLMEQMPPGVKLKVDPSDATTIRYDIIRSFDRPLLNFESVAKMDANLTTELDWQLF